MLQASKTHLRELNFLSGKTTDTNTILFLLKMKYKIKAGCFLAKLLFYLINYILKGYSIYICTIYEVVGLFCK